MLPISPEWKCWIRVRQIKLVGLGFFSALFFIPTLFPLRIATAQATSQKFPIVYSPHYDISFFGIEKFHPFDSRKYGKIYRHLIKAGWQKEIFYEPPQASKEDLLLVHSAEYLDSLKDSKAVARIAELPTLAFLPNFLLQKNLLEPMNYGAGGTILASQLALKNGWSINLSGGYHHAKADSGGGFCFFADVPIAIRKLMKEHPDMTYLIIDLDAHQGNGHESVLKDDPRVSIFDVYNGQIYPGDTEAKQYIDFDFPVRSGIKDVEYLELINKKVPKVIEKVKPGIIFYIAGTDVFEEDPLGMMKVSQAGIIKRDEIVFRAARNRKIPIVMVLGGGYTKKNASNIAESIQNLLANVLR